MSGGGYAEARDLILKELAGALGNVEETEVSRLVRMICDAEKVFVVGVEIGRASCRERV